MIATVVGLIMVACAFFVLGMRYQTKVIAKGVAQCTKHASAEEKATLLQAGKIIAEWGRK